MSTQQPASPSTTARLIGLGVVSLLCYLAANFWLPLSAQGRAEPAATLADGWAFWDGLMRLPTPSDSAVLGLGLATAIVPLAAYLAALWVSWRVPASRRLLGVVIGFMVAFFLTSVFTLPQNSNDIYGYINYARVLAVYGANPYVVPPDTFAPDPFLGYVGPGWMEVTTPYGPVWMAVSAALAGLGGESVPGTLLVFRSALFICNLANVALIGYLLRCHAPAHLLPGLLFYAWNPIVVLKGQGHNEPVMLLFLLVAVGLHYAGRRWLALASLGLSALTKFVTAPLVPLYLLHWWRRVPLRWLAMGLGLAAALGALVVLPLWGSDFILTRLWQRITVSQSAEQPSLRVLASGVAVLGAMLWAAWRDRRGPAGTAEDRFQHMLTGWAVVLYAWAFLFPDSSYAWHAITLIGLVSLLRVPALVVIVAALVVSAHLNNQLVTVVGDAVDVPVVVFRVVRWGIPAMVWGMLLVSGWRSRADNQVKQASRTPTLP